MAKRRVLDYEEEPKNRRRLSKASISALLIKEDWAVIVSKFEKESLQKKAGVFTATHYLLKQNDNPLGDSIPTSAVPLSPGTDSMLALCQGGRRPQEHS